MESPTPSAFNAALDIDVSHVFKPRDIYERMLPAAPTSKDLLARGPRMASQRKPQKKRFNARKTKRLMARASRKANRA
jgi:hypothetical protein